MLILEQGRIVISWYEHDFRKEVQFDFDVKFEMSFRCLRGDDEKAVRIFWGEVFPVAINL